MIIIELCGTPGCGKTTFSEMLYKELKKSYRVFILHGLRKSYSNKLTGLKEKLYRSLYRKSETIDETLCNYINYIGNVYESEVLDSIRKKMLYKDYIIKYCEKRGVEIMIIDEGFVQNMSSLIHEKQVDGKYVKECLQYIEKKIYRNRLLLIHCYIDVDEDIKRLKLRNSQGDRYLIGDNIEIKKRLVNNENNISQLVAFLASEKITHIDATELQEKSGSAIKKIEKGIIQIKCINEL